VNDEFERIWMEAVVVSVKVLPRYLPGGTEERHRKLQSGQPVSWPKFELRTSRIQIRNVNHSTMTFDHCTQVGLQVDVVRCYKSTHFI
jgi:hypothetical protein